jgi:hypothetical protein
MKRHWLAVAGILFLAGSVCRAGGGVWKQAEGLRQPPELLRWQRIPWLTDLDEGIRTARAEKRPLLIWASGDDPLERC